MLELVVTVHDTFILQLENDLHSTSLFDEISQHSQMNWICEIVDTFSGDVLDVLAVVELFPASVTEKSDSGTGEAGICLAIVEKDDQVVHCSMIPCSGWDLHSTDDANAVDSSRPLLTIRALNEELVNGIARVDLQDREGTTTEPVDVTEGDLVSDLDVCHDLLISFLG
jgi:hypothetical protein